MKTTARSDQRILTLLASFAIALVSGLAHAKKTDIPQGGIKPDDLMIVDCLLPGQVRQLGEGFTYLSARRPVRSSAKECSIRGGEYVAFDRANYGTALKVWLPAAKEGNGDAMTYVGEIYEKGLGVTPDYATAVGWYKKAAEKGHNGAMINLGSLYERGLGVSKDMVQAMNWYRKASGLTESTLEITTEAEIAQRKSDAEELERLRGETSKLRGELASLNSKLAEAEKSLTSTQEQLMAARTAADKAKAQGAAAAQAALAKVSALEGELNSQRTALREAQAGRNVTLSKLGIDPTQKGPAPPGTKPQLKIIAPEKLAMTRAGVLAAPLLSQVANYAIVGRVYPSEGLKSLRVNDQEIKDKLDADGMFEVTVSMAQSDTPVEVQAITSDGLSTIENFVLSFAGNNAAPGAAGKRSVSPNFARRMRSDLGSFHALVIGNNDYNSFPDLKTAVNDATEIGKVLSERYGYKVTTLTNATRAQVIAKLSELTTSLKKTDNLMIYFAGHGWIDAAGDGHWVPTEGVKDKPETLISNKIVTDFIGATQAKHVMVVADSCYSGTLSGTAIRPIPLEAKEDDLLFISRVKARTVITSGGMEPVLDDGGGNHSIFAAAFLKALNSNDSLTEGSRLFESVRNQVSLRSAVARVSQSPQYSALKFAGHEGSEFFFLPRA
jgi:TPR repeat protein